MLALNLLQKLQIIYITAYMHSKLYQLETASNRSLNKWECSMKCVILLDLQVGLDSIAKQNGQLLYYIFRQSVLIQLR